jgi:hypothetical protein
MDRRWTQIEIMTKQNNKKKTKKDCQFRWNKEKDHKKTQNNKKTTKRGFFYVPPFQEDVLVCLSKN